MLGKIADGFMVYVMAPFACIFAIVMSLLTADMTALVISIIGTAGVAGAIAHGINKR